MSLFASAEEKAVLALTEESLRESDVGGNLRLADELRTKSDDGKSVLKHLLKRVQHKNDHVKLLALSLLDVLVKNGTTAFHMQLGRTENLKQLCELASNMRLNPRVRDTVLTLIEGWSEAFTRPGEFQIPAFQEAYQKLKRTGVEFPPRDMTALAPIRTPAAGRPQQPRRSSSAADPYAPAESAYSSSPNLAGQHPSPLYPHGQQGYMQPSPYGQQQPVQPVAYPVAYPTAAPVQYPYAHPAPPMQPAPHPQQQQQQQPQHADESARKRAKLSDKETKVYLQCTYLSDTYVARLKNETNLSYEWIGLLRDLSSAAESPAALKADTLASNLQRVLVEVRNRYTKLVLELSDINAPDTVSAAEFLLDLCIHMIDAIGIILAYHKQRCEGQASAPPVIEMPKSLKQLHVGEHAGTSQQSAQPLQPAQPAPAEASPQQQHEMVLFDLPVSPPQEDDQKQAASIFATHRPPKATASQLSQLPSTGVPESYVPPVEMPITRTPARPEEWGAMAAIDAHREERLNSSPVDAAAAAATAAPGAPATASPSPAPVKKRFESSSGFQPAESFSPAGVNHASRSPPLRQPAADSPGETANASSVASQFQSMSLAPPAEMPLPVERTPFDEVSPKGDATGTEVEGAVEEQAPPQYAAAAGSNSSASAQPAPQPDDQSNLFDLLAPMRSSEAPGHEALRKSSNAPGGPSLEAQSSLPSVSDSYLDDLMAFTVPQPAAESKEGEP